MCIYIYTCINICVYLQNYRRAGRAIWASDVDAVVLPANAAAGAAAMVWVLSIFICMFVSMKNRYIHIYLFVFLCL